MNLFRSIPFKLIFLSGLLVGALDILAAFLDFFFATNKNPLVILKYIASAVFGAIALSGGIGMTLAGLFFHFIIALLFTFFFFVLYSNTNLLSKNRWVTGVAYAIFIWFVMNEMVIPLSKAPYLQLDFNDINKIIKAIVILIFTIGLPLSFLGHYFFREQQNVKWPKH